MNNLEDVISDAVNDAQIDETPEVVDTPATDDAPVVEDTPVEATEESTESTESTDSVAVKSPASRDEAPEDTEKPQDEFEKAVGMAPVGVGGRENRIPYSRVKKITEKAVNDVAEAALGRKLNPGEKAVDVVRQHVAELPVLKTKVTDYESRLEKVGEFEDIMANQPERFLQIISKLPAYKEFFEFVQAAASAQQGVPQNTPTSHSAAPTTGSVPSDDPNAMPEPDEPLADGTLVYSMDGLKRLLEWNGKQVEQRVSKQFEERYKPIENDWQERRRIEATLPIIRQKITEARTWPLFNDNEAEITRVLEADPNISLEGAYNKVVVPKLQADRTKMRQELLAEVKKAPTSTSVPTRVATKPAAPNADANRSIEDIIREQVKTISR